MRDTFDDVEPELVILDLQIGNMGGVAVAHDLRLEESAGRLDRARILLLLDREADEFIGRRADVDMMLVKPVDAGVLRRAAKHLLETVPATRETDDEYEDDDFEARHHDDADGFDDDDSLPVVDVS